MQKLVREYLNELKSRQKKRRRTGIAAILLIVLVVGGVVGVLTQYGVAMTGNAKCGLEEHQHGEECYASEMTCGLEEMAGHSHTDACYQTETVLICGQEESAGHTHADDCYGEDGTSVCGQEESAGHTHTDDCYQTDSVQICGQEESAGHTHTAECTESQMACGMEEHSHTDQCYIDTEAGVEEAALWEAQYKDTEWKDAWGEDLVTAAQKQIGYKENSDNYTIAEDGSRKGYTRYGQFAGDVYCDWDAAFVNFCIFYAGLEASGIFPSETDTAKWCGEFEKINGQDERYISCLTAAEGYTPEAGDIIFLEKEDEERTSQMGVVSSYNKEKNEIRVIEGNSGNEVKENPYDAGDAHIVRYLKISELEKAYKGTGEEAQDAEEAQPVEAPAEESEAVQADEVKKEENPEGEDTEGKESEEKQEQDEEGKLSEEELSQVDEVIALIDDIPSPEEIQKKMEALEDDEEEYEKYYLKLQKQVMEAFEAYEALSEAQQEKVTNAEKLLQMDWMKAETLEEQTGDSTWSEMEPDEAYVNEIKITQMITGSAPFDETGDRGNDTTPDDKLVRTFDTVTYNFNVNMKSWDSSKSYSKARVKLEFVLPLSEKDAAFEQTAMAWMDQTEGYKPVVTTETREIDGEEKKCQVLTCYKQLLPSEGNQSVVPGDFGENLTISVKGMKNGEKFAPIISAAMEGGAWDEPCDKEEHEIDGKPAVEKKTVIADEVEVTAAPKYNIQVKGDSSYADDFYFQGDEEWMEKYRDIAANTDIEKPLPGRAMKLGITIQLYNDNASKGLKGIELPDGSDITFDLELSSKYKINTPNENSDYKKDQVIEDSSYAPLLWSYNEVDWKEFGSTNKDGRRIDDRLKATPYAPYNRGDSKNACFDGGNWTASQEGDTVHITVSDYKIDTQKMPSLNGDGGTGVTYDKNVGCFSAGEIWLIQPFNKKEGDGVKPNYDIVKTYGQGSFATTAEARNMKVTTVSGDKLVQGEGFQQMVSNDDRETRTLELTLGGFLQNRVRYADASAYELGCGIVDNRDGRDYAAVGSELNLMGGLSYNPNRIEENQMYLGTTLLKFYGSAIELEKEDWFLHLEGGAALNGHDDKEIEKAEENVRFYYAVKKDGSDWKSDEELKTTYEDQLEFYDSLDEIPNGKTCVGMLISFIGPGGDVLASDPYYRCYHKARVKDDMKLAGQTFMLASTSRVWTKEMFEKAEMGLEEIDPAKNPELNIPQLILEEKLWNCGHYTSANIDGSVFYTKETYRSDGSGIEGTHNSDWYHWGDTLLIIGYKTKITKNLLQKDNGGEEKKTFSLDADQRVADFKLQPAAYYDKPGEFQQTARITIVDTLPKHMTYKPGSAYFGGAYKQTSELGGKKGEIIRDETEGAEFPDPKLTEPEVTENADGTQTLKWIIDDVKVGKPMAPIYYSTDIGVKGNPEEDIPQGTSNLTNKVYIATPLDLRDPETTAEKHAEAGITVTKGSASSFGKYTKQKVVDEDGAIDYVVYFNNNAQTEAMVEMMDTMPMNKISGSHFTGTYTFDKWEIDKDKCDIKELKIYYTFEQGYKDKTVKDVPLPPDGEISKDWKEAEINTDGSIKIPTEKEGATKDQPYPVAWAVVGALESGKSVNINLRIQLDPGASDKDRDEKDYNYFVNRLSSGDTTITTETPTVRRTLEGLTWMDYNRDGIQGDVQTETRISGVKVELLKLKEGENADPEDEESYENVYYPGSDKDNEENRIIIETGRKISVRAESKEDAVEYEAGRYKFTDLPAGTFAVRFTDGNGETKISKLNASKPDCGTDDTLDSDGIPGYDEEDKLQKTVILNLTMPKAEDMSVSLYESKYHDSGFYPDTLVKLEKKDEAGNSLPGAIFTIQDSKGNIMAFTYDENEKVYSPFVEEKIDPELIGKYYIAYAANTDYVVEINGNWDGAVPILKKRNGNALQLFDITDHEGDLKSFLNVGSGKWLDLDGGSLNKGAKIHVWSNNEPNANQKWHVISSDQGGGCYISPSTSNGNEWSMDLSGGNVYDGATIHLWEKNESDAQKWLLIPAAGNVEENDEKVEARTDLIGDANGNLTIHDLIPGDYTITEMKSPTGYSLLREPVKFTLKTDGNVELKGTGDGMASVGSDVVSDEEKKIVLKIRNEKVYKLPSAGGMGIYWYMFGGVLLMSAAAFITYRNKRREVLRS